MLKMEATSSSRTLMSLYELLLVALKMEGEAAKWKVLHKDVLELVPDVYQYVKLKAQKVDSASCQSVEDVAK
jgi:hypothetical protein